MTVLVSPAAKVLTECFCALEVGVVGALLLMNSPVSAQPLPQDAPDTYLGVSSCAGAPCHGNVAAVGKVVRQNEYSTWIAEDRHARAYEVLLNEPSQRIARNLALDQPASESPLCLDCHADHVPHEFSEVGCVSLQLR